MYDKNQLQRNNPSEHCEIPYNRYFRVPESLIAVIIDYGKIQIILLTAIEFIFVFRIAVQIPHRFHAPIISPT